MHSGSFISPKHPAIPVSIGIASIVLEGRSSCDENTISSDIDDGDSLEEVGTHYVGEYSKTLMQDAAQRINQKLQLIRTCPGTSKDVVENVVGVTASSSSRPEDYPDFCDNFNSKGFPNTSSLFSRRDSWSPPPRQKNIYSGFEKMKVLSSVSPIKTATSYNQFVNVSVKKKQMDKQRPKEGPHCEQFLRKIGLIKTDPTEDIEHACTYRNDFCCRWQVYLKQLSSIISSGESICIEVYLGPEKHAILLEQWTMKLKTKKTDSTMTLQSLCAAIRSQLYFSQISAWNDLIKSAAFDTVILENPRIKNMAATLTTPKLDILFRIKTFDNTACFNDKPTVHHFPDAIVSENIVIQVCLKSLPRLEKIPDLYDELDSKMEDLVDDRMNLPCHEKGKHRCAFQEEEEEEEDTAIVGDVTTAKVAMSHREKQLLKYKKLLLKREKKKKSSESSGSDSSVLEYKNHQQSTKINIPINTYPTYTSSINSIQPPLYSNCDDKYNTTAAVTATTTTTTKSTQTAIFKLNSSNNISVATQTEDSLVCCYCSDMKAADCSGRVENNSESTKRDIKMQYININNNYDYDNCDKNYADDGSYGKSCGKGIKKSDLLLQAIQRTAIFNTITSSSSSSPSRLLSNNNNNINNNNISNTNNNFNKLPSDMSKSERSECDKFNNVDLGDCRLCKRQKTKHNFKTRTTNNNTTNNNNINYNNSDDCNGLAASCYRRTISESLVGHLNMSLKNDDLNTVASTLVIREELKTYRRAFSEDVIDTMIGNEDIEDEMIGCTCDQLKAESHTFKTPIRKTSTPTPMISCKNPLHITCNEPTSTEIASPPNMNKKKKKNVPKINLTNIFNTSPLARDDSGFLTSNSSLASSSPIPIDNNVFKYEQTPVQKSNSAPSFNLSPSSLSPRFLRSISKHRSRYLSERSSVSERSSIGSDEQYSDEEFSLLENNFSPSLSPTKSASNVLPRNYNKNIFKFGKLPMLGTLEESLLQRRFKPKFHVADFKVLLGASGSFCPTQLTIPASTYFYELYGQHLTTPYMCELRLPRKGYSIPRTGTVQVTLLNPLGTVVRMFVVPYDFRDMPPMSMTFIRQRLLAYDDSMKSLGKNIEQLSNADQMKLLRYAIHLRFQTSRSGKLSLHTDIKLLISRRTDCDTAAAHAKNLLEAPNELKIVTIVPDNPKFSSRIDKV